MYIKSCENARLPSRPTWTKARMTPHHGVTAHRECLLGYPMRKLPPQFRELEGNVALSQKHEGMLGGCVGILTSCRPQYRINWHLTAIGICPLGLPLFHLAKE